jgi:flagellar FliL protein
MATEPVAERKKSKIPILAGVVALVAIIGVGAGLYIRHGRTESSGAPSPHKPVNSILHLETFTANMDDPEGKSFIRVGIDLGLQHEPANGSASTPLVRDTILSVLMAAKPEDLSSLPGKQKLKEVLLTALQARAPELGVREVYFTEFLLQR